MSGDLSHGALGDQVRGIIEEAERTAAAITADVETAARREAAQIVAEAEADAAWIRKEAEARAARYLDDSAARLDEVVQQRLDRIAELSDELLASAAALQGRFANALEVRESLDALVRSLGVAADQLAATTREPLPDLEPMTTARTPRPPTFTGESRPIRRSAEPTPQPPARHHGPEARSGGTVVKLAASAGTAFGRSPSSHARASL